MHFNNSNQLKSDLASIILDNDEEQEKDRNSVLRIAISGGRCFGFKHSFLMNQINKNLSLGDDEDDYNDEFDDDDEDDDLGLSDMLSSAFSVYPSTFGFASSITGATVNGSIQG
ncbi:unnamed protein product [Onchocerca flexuosa]|uniref:Uncharacterized protein n=1 Tax=Onchocerca flexuosa TaxID=387005 RepID=A0A183HT68_9BILA|nr:unnamed protein product [Onchocerca flexuosa]